uniref:uncharacterized protein isoform X1 n=1 Tax=Myxine glutinosa TaxID=7769 RepID=UPI00358E0890
MNSSSLNLHNMSTNLSAAQGPSVSHQDPYHSNETAKHTYDQPMEVDKNAALCSNNLINHSIIRFSLTPPCHFNASSDDQARMQASQRIWETSKSIEPERLQYLEDLSPRETESQRSQRSGTFLGSGDGERGTLRYVDGWDRVKPEGKESRTYGELLPLKNMRERQLNDWAPEGHEDQGSLIYGRAMGSWERKGHEGLEQFDAWAPIEPTDQQGLRCRMNLQL